MRWTCKGCPVGIVLAGMLLLTVSVGAEAARPRGASGGNAASHDAKPTESRDADEYDVNLTTMTVSHSAVGSVERLVANDTADALQIGRVRAALHREADRVADGDFPAPAGPRGTDLPGLAVLQRTSPGDVRAMCVEIRGGAEIRYSADDPAVAAALRAWLDARLDMRNSAPPPGGSHAAPYP